MDVERANRQVAAGGAEVSTSELVASFGTIGIRKRVAVQRSAFELRGMLNERIVAKGRFQVNRTAGAISAGVRYLLSARITR